MYTVTDSTVTQHPAICTPSSMMVADSKACKQGPRGQVSRGWRDHQKRAFGLSSNTVRTSVQYVLYLTVNTHAHAHTRPAQQKQP